MKFNLKLNSRPYTNEYIGDGLKICADDLRKHFAIPRSQDNIQFIVTKTKHPEAYEFSKKIVTYKTLSLFNPTPRTRRRTDYQLDGRSVMFYANTNSAITCLLRMGYKYVRCTYE